MPFIIIFGLIIAFIKFDRDKEIIAIFFLGLSINQIKKPIIFFAIFISIIYILLNYFISPIIYDIYKKKEFELRNLIDFNNINIANFIEIDKNLILDFHKKDGEFRDVLIRFNDELENFIYAKKANIEKLKKEIVFNLYDGFKLTFKEGEIEKLEFESYKFKFPTKNDNFYSNIDTNSITLFGLIKNKDYKSIFEKIFEPLIIVTIIIFFYFLKIKKNNYGIKKIFIFLVISITLIIVQNIIKNINLSLGKTIIFILLNIMIPYLYLIYKRKDT